MAVIKKDQNDLDLDEKLVMDVPAPIEHPSRMEYNGKKVSWNQTKLNMTYLDLEQILCSLVLSAISLVSRAV